MKDKYPFSFWVMCLGAMLFFLSFNMVLPELPDLLRSLGGIKYIGWIISLFSIFALIARPFSGWVTDNWGRKPAMLLGAGFCIVASILYPIAGSIVFFFVIRALHGFITGFTPTGLAAFTTDIVPHHRRGEALGWQGMFSNIGASAGFALGSFVLLWLGNNGLYITAGAFAAISLLLFAQLPETKPENHNITHWIKGMVYPKAWKPAMLMMLVCIPIGSILTIIPDYTLFCGFSNKGMYLTIYIFSSLFVRIFSGRLSDSFGRPLSLIIGSFSQIISMALLLAYSGNIAFVFSAILYGVGQGFNAPALFAWGGDVSSAHSRGRALSTLFIGLESGIIFGALASGYLITRFPYQFSNVFILNLGVTAVAFLVATVFHWKKDTEK